jgi:prepilin-type N-terminal cleavage/methylation domain-containing protein
MGLGVETWYTQVPACLLIVEGWSSIGRHLFSIPMARKWNSQFLEYKALAGKPARGGKAGWGIPLPLSTGLFHTGSAEQPVLVLLSALAYAGFTLLELMIVITIILIARVSWAPWLGHWLR